MGPLGYLAYMMFGPGLVCFMVIMFFVFVLLMFTVCFYAQLFMENLVLYRRVEYDDTSESVRDASLLLNNKSNKKNKKRK